MNLKMVAGKTYICPPIFGSQRVIERGEVVEVLDPAQAQILLDDVYSDGLNNVHHYFIETEEVAGGASAPATKAPAKAVKAAGRTRTRSQVEQ